MMWKTGAQWSIESIERDLALGVGTEGEKRWGCASLRSGGGAVVADSIIRKMR